MVSVQSLSSITNKLALIIRLLICLPIKECSLQRSVWQLSSPRGLSSAVFTFHLRSFPRSRSEFIKFQSANIYLILVCNFIQNVLNVFENHHKSAGVCFCVTVIVNWTWKGCGSISSVIWCDAVVCLWSSTLAFHVAVCGSKCFFCCSWVVIGRRDPSVILGSKLYIVWLFIGVVPRWQMEVWYPLFAGC